MRKRSIWVHARSSWLCPPVKIRLIFMVCQVLDVLSWCGLHGIAWFFLMVRSPDNCFIVKCFLLLIWLFFFFFLLFIAMWNKLYRRDQTRFSKSVFLERTFLLKQNQKFNNLDRNYYDSCWHTLLLNEFIKNSESVYSVQFSSVGQSCPTLCHPMNHSMPGLPVHYQLPEFTQTHVHRVSDATQPSHPLSSPFPPAPNPSQHQSLFQWVSSLHEVAKVLESQL